MAVYFIFIQSANLITSLHITSIPINAQTHFGNVLPNSIRKFEFTWKGEQSLSDIGRYKAVVTLGYGIEGRKFQSSATYFWVIPVKSVLMVLGGALFIVLFVLCFPSYS